MLRPAVLLPGGGLRGQQAQWHPPCHHLGPADGCGIHATLREDGWAGCTVFERFGAGQQVSQVTCAGVSWCEHDDLDQMVAVLAVDGLGDDAGQS